jgi:hypothetical protein
MTMDQSGAFLSAGEYEKFRKPGRCRRRSIVELPLEAAPGLPPKARGLVSYVLGQLKSLVASDARRFECICIRVKEGDGMTWSAEAVYEAITEHYPHFTRWALAGRMTPDSMPLIASLIGVRKFLKLAVDHHLTTSFITLRSWVAPVIVASAVLAAAASKLLEVLLKAHTQDVSQLPLIFSDYKLYAVSLGLASLGLILQQFTTFLTTRTKAKSVEKFLQELPEKQKTRPYADFVESVASQVRSTGFPRFVTIDNYESLDYTTAQVIHSYSRSHLRYAIGSEFWVIFEREDGENFSNQALAGEYPDATVRLFEQALLTGEEKLELIRILDKPESAAEFATVKSICHGFGEGQERLDALFKEYRLSHPKDDERYGNLEFLYLLSLTATPGEVPFPHRSIVGKFSAKAGLRADVLKQFLKGTALTREEFRTCLTEVETDFKSALLMEGSGELRSVRTTPEAAEILEASADELKLPNARLGHLYWAFYWYDERQNDPVQAFWIRKLAFHVLAADPSRMKDGPERLVPHLLEILLFTVDGCLKTCIFRDVQKLLRKAVDLLYSDELREDISYQRRLLRRCWEAYWMLAEEEILRLILDIYAISGTALDGDTREADALETLFFESMPLLHGSRARLQAAADRWAGGKLEASEAIFDYAKARSAWLALTIAPNLGDLGVTALLRAAIEARGSIDEIARRAWERVTSAPDAPPTLTDVMTLSAAMWCAALKCNKTALYSIVSSGATEVRETWMQEALARALNDAVVGRDSSADLLGLLDITDTAILLAGELSGGAAKGAPGPGETDFPMNGLVRELCAVAIASIVAAYSYLAKWGVPSQNQVVVGRVQTVIAEINKILGTKLPQVEVVDDLTSPQLRKEIDALMRACGIMWHAFGLYRLRDFMSIRRAHFDAICTHVEPENFHRYRLLLESLACLHEMDFPGLIANLVVADSLSGVAELGAHYLCQAGTIAVRGEFGSRLKWELSLVAVGHGYSFGYNLAEFLTTVLEGSEGRQDGLAEVLNGVAPERLCGHILRFLESSRKVEQPELTAKYRQAIEAFVSRQAPEDIRREVQSLLDALSLEENIASGAVVNAEQVVTQWHDRRKLWTYAWVLQRLLPKGDFSPTIKRECIQVLSRDPSVDKFNTYFFLALDIASQGVLAAKNEECGVAASYLRRSIGIWVNNMPANINARVYRVLEQLEPNGQELYHAETVKWELVKLQRDHLRRLPEFLKQGRFFVVFKDYWDAMMWWGLRTELPLNEAYNGLNVDQKSMQRAVRQWKETGGVVPSPWAELGRQTVVSAQFLYLGHYLFSPPNDEDRTLDGDRQRFDEGARRALPKLLEMVVDLPELPAAIKELVASFSKRFLTYTLPEGEQPAA